jgi:hypothetical protein
MPLALEKLLDEFTAIGFVVNDQYIRHAGHDRTCRATPGTANPYPILDNLLRTQP